MPRTECLKDVIAADAALLGDAIVRPTSAPGNTVLVAAHGNSLRALVKHLDGISDEDIAGLNIPTGMPLVYGLDDDFMPTGAGASTSTPTPPRPPRPRWPTRAADRRRAPPAPGQSRGSTRFVCSPGSKIRDAGPTMSGSGVPTTSVSLLR